MSKVEEFNKQVNSYVGAYSKEFDKASKAIQDSMTAEQKLFAYEQRVEQLEKLNDTLSQGYDNRGRIIERLKDEQEQMWSDHQIEATILRRTLRLVIRRQIDGQQDS